MNNSRITPADKLIGWYEKNGRTIAWRNPETSAWGILLSEVMSQQTPVTRVEPLWLEWIDRWPTPAALASASNADVLRAWHNLGYPRRALRLKQAAEAMVQRHGGEVPSTVDELLALPGIGDYTARAVAAFAYGQAVPVVDTNVRRVIARWIHGRLLAGPARKADLEDAVALLPQRDAATFSVAVMELGALVCAKQPHCEHCPIVDDCTWQRLGCPQPQEEEVRAAARRVQKFEGTDRQVRGKIMAVLRASESPVALKEIDLVWPDAAQRSRALFSLIEDGLAIQTDPGHLSLPA
ncbi:A/G-specific adenine glycosylase [Corynebacterium sp. SCR221107]|uniref:A/G-specific adenine glycosylase n=1 Tax=Corynebacterium sp. SCR221107 TaxID=3017361 RepID=UPI0022EC4452|nr:A/G-specific adenine glycosylase [Corynebacterium sp. SCR221107]WBT08381.1 A/G-specific adenine glycosylase [Corynebacterium sp. SCR221107]